MKYRLIVTIIAVFAVFSALRAQSAREAAALMRSYQFDKAAAAYGRLLSSDPADSSALEGLVSAENAIVLTATAARPAVVATKTVPRGDFFLWYGNLTAGAWSSDGNWWKTDATEHFFSRPSAGGGREIVRSAEVDSAVWSNPEILCQDAVSKGNEIFPMVSPDGKRLYFCSDGLFGMGGYDIYVAHWDASSKTWGNVQNMGFPFNSPDDDLLFCDMPDGRWSLFASNRTCGKDSVTIYVIRQENFVQEPVERSEVPSVARLRVTSPDAGYQFVKLIARPAPEFAFEEPEEEFDTGFKVQAVGAFAENNTLPPGLVYQVQLFVSGSKPSVKQLKGISPVYAIRQKSGKTIYAAGLFRGYAAAEAALPAARRAGFPSAFIIAFDDGKPISLQKARQKESSVKVITEEVHIVK